MSLLERQMVGGSAMKISKVGGVSSKSKVRKLQQVILDSDADRQKGS